jgi:TAT (twin-arginine translocation) pathway signal sequence
VHRLPRQASAGPSRDAHERVTIAGKGSPLEQPLSRRQFLVATGVGAASLALPGPVSGAPNSLARGIGPGDSVVLQWNQAFLHSVRDSKLGPPMVARALAIAHTCIYDAWAAYDDRAVGTRFGGSLRRPPRERTFPNREQAISFAAYRAAVDLFPGSASSVFDPVMHSLGYEPADRSTETSMPTGIGNFAAQAVLDFHHRDGANQLGDEPGGAARVPYSDYTGYSPANEPRTFERRSIPRPFVTRTPGSPCATRMPAAAR